MIIIARVKKPLPAVLGLAWGFSVFLFVYLISRPGDAAAAVVDSLGVCASKLIPSLFPFMVLTNLICSTGLADLISRVIGGAFARATGIPASGAPVFLLGSIGGFPVGAVAARRLADNSELSKKDAAPHRRRPVMQNVYANMILRLEKSSFPTKKKAIRTDGNI